MIQRYWPLLVALAGALHVAIESGLAAGWDWYVDGPRVGVSLAAAFVAWATANAPLGSGWSAMKSAATLVVGAGGAALVGLSDHLWSTPDTWALITAVGVSLGLLAAPATATSLRSPRLANGTPARLAARQ